MSDYTNLLNNAASLDYAPALQPFTGVRLWYDDDACYFAGDESGRVMEADCPWATQAMANSVLDSIRGFEYQPFEAGTTLLDPEAELGDGVNVGGVYAPLASVNTTFGAMCFSDISAPADEEVDHEYPFMTKQERELSRKVALGKSYYGTRITRQNGLEVIKTDGEGTETARVRLNSDELAFYDARGNEALYFDAAAGKYRFRGDVEITGGTMNVNDNFIVDANGNLTINGNINLSNGNITWGGNAPGGGGGGISESEAKTLITSELVSSPTIRGAKVYGGRFYDTEGAAYITMDASNGAGHRYSYLEFYSGAKCVFSIDSDNSLSDLDPSASGRSVVTMNTLNGSLLKSETIFNGESWRSTIYPYGSWNFSNANVSLKGATELLNNDGERTGWFGSGSGETVNGVTTYGVALASNSTPILTDGSYSLDFESEGRYVLVTTNGIKLKSGENTRITLTDSVISVRALNGTQFRYNNSEVVTMDTLRAYGLIN